MYTALTTLSQEFVNVVLLVIFTKGLYNLEEAAVGGASGFKGFRTLRRHLAT